MQQLISLIKLKRSLVFFVFILAVHFISAAHYAVGIANDALDGRSANDFQVVLWNPANGIGDNLTDVIGQNGNSGYDNFYMIDCEALDTPCSIGDILNVKIFSYPYSSEENVTITGAGFDIASNITLNSLPEFLSLTVDDSFQFPTFPENEIDLIAGSTQHVSCEAVIEEPDGDLIQNILAEFFDNSLSFFGDSDDNNLHYTNNSCFTNSSYGEANQVQVICGFDVLYNANAGEWNCTITAQDNLSAIGIGSDTTSVNQLLSVGINDYLDFGEIGGGEVSDEAIMNITNMGNVMVDLRLFGYGSSEGDGYAMVCQNGEIPIGYKKYNLTDSNPGVLNLNEFEETYINLTTLPTVREFNLNYRQEESSNEAVNSTYWRIYAPLGISGSCSGNIVVGAVVG